jgi:ADP-ribose pyrophosphatase
MKKTPAEVISSKLVFQGPVFGVRRDRVREPRGMLVTRDVVTHTGSVVLLPVFLNGDILLVRQYRHAIRQFLWELVAGRIEAGERPLAAARRELAEETGFTARKFKRLMSFFPTPGFVSERMIVYAALGLSAGKARPESDEQIEWQRFSQRNLERMLRTGKLCDAKSIAAVLYFWRFHSR